MGTSQGPVNLVPESKGRPSSQQSFLAESETEKEQTYSAKYTVKEACWLKGPAAERKVYDAKRCCQQNNFYMKFSKSRRW